MPHIPLPRSYRKEFYNAPKWVFNESVSLSGRKAAKYMGMGYERFMLSVDSFGLTVLYRVCRSMTRKYFLISELDQLKRRMSEVALDDVLAGREGRLNSILDMEKKKSRKKWRGGAR